MTYRICYWDSSTNSQQERDATPSETAEIDARVSSALQPVVPFSVTMRQARLMLLTANLLTNVQDIISGMGGIEGETARINWEYAQTVQRDDPLVKQLIPSLGKSEAEIDQMFIDAANL